MATWMVHFRIAENLLKMNLLVSEKEFLVGNIGPDCGLPDEVTGEFYPPKKRTHFKVDDEMNPNFFLEQYLKKAKMDFNNPQFSFYLGYYLHLVTDVEWSQLHQEKKKEPGYQEILGTPEYERILKRDWYGADFVYLNENKDNIFINLFQHIKSFPDYLDIFPEQQISRQIKRITEFYLVKVDFRSNALSCFEASAAMQKQSDAFRGHDFSLLDEQARLWGLQLMLFPLESPPSTPIN